MKTYQHTQTAHAILFPVVCMVVIFAVVGVLKFPPLLLAVALLSLVAWLFHSLTIEIAEGELRWRFGPGWIRKRVALDLITSAEPVRTKVFEGWGIHLSRFGWLYNVSGFEAVAIRM